MVAVNHGIDTLRVTRLYLHAARLLYRTYDATICVSNKLKEEVERKLRISCAVIPLPLKLETYRPAKPEDRDDLVVHIGTRPIKNPQISIETIKSLRRRGLPIKLVIVGAPTTVPKEDGIEERFSRKDSASARKKSSIYYAEQRRLYSPQATRHFHTWFSRPWRAGRLL